MNTLKQWQTNNPMEMVNEKLAQYILPSQHLLCMLYFALTKYASLIDADNIHRSVSVEQKHQLITYSNPFCNSVETYKAITWYLSIPICILPLKSPKCYIIPPSALRDQLKYQFLVLSLEHFLFAVQCPTHTHTTHITLYLPMLLKERSISKAMNQRGDYLSLLS